MGILDFKRRHLELVLSAEADIEEVYYMNDLPWVIGYSGGKDSTCTTQLIINTLIKLKNEGKNLHKPVYVISSDTLVETPMIVRTIHNTIDSINELAQRYEIPLSAYIIRPSYDNTFWTNLIGKGYPCPNQKFRWCTDRMKINPANQFIMSIVDKYGEAVMILGVREGESNSRDQVLENHTIQGKKLMRHTTMANAYVFAPIRRFDIEDVWNYLLENESPWGGDNKELYNLYKESAEDCPLIIDKETKEQASCGNSRFGCWVCTVVSKDKSLTSFIEKGETWLTPLLEFRNWLYLNRDNESFRMRRRMDGSIYFSKIKTISEDEVVIPAKGGKKKITIKYIENNWIDDSGNVWTLFEGVDSEERAKQYIAQKNINLSDGSTPRILVKTIDDEVKQLGSGPFTLEGRKQILRKLLELQKLIGDRYQLYKIEELLEIRKIWLTEGMLDDEVAKMFYEVNGYELPNVLNDDIRLFDNGDMDLLDKICERKGFNFSLMHSILNLEKKYMGYNNRQEVNKQLRKILSQEFVHVENGSDFDED